MLWLKSASADIRMYIRCGDCHAASEVAVLPASRMYAARVHASKVARCDLEPMARLRTGYRAARSPLRSPPTRHETRLCDSALRASKTPHGITV